MAYLQSRSNIARSGVTYCGWVPPAVRTLIAGTNRSSSVLPDSISIRLSLDPSPATMTFSTEAAFTPTFGQSVAFQYTSPNLTWFAGTIVRRRLRVQTRGELQWEVTALDTTWLADRRGDHIAGTYSGGANTVLANVIADGGSPVTTGLFFGGCDQAFGDVSIHFEYVTISQAITQLAAACGAYWKVDPEGYVYFFTTLVDGNALTVGNTSSVANVTYDEDGTQLRNIDIVIGGGTTATADATIDSTSIAVANTREFSTSGGFFATEDFIGLYSTVSPSNGPGTITWDPGAGVLMGLLQYIDAGDRIRVVQSPSDAASIIALSAIFGGVGIFPNVINDDGLTLSAANTLGIADLETYSMPLKGLSFETQPDYPQEREVWPGKLVTLNITAPVTLSATMIVQSVTIKPRLLKSLTVTPQFIRSVDARPVIRTVESIIRKVA